MTRPIYEPSLTKTDAYLDFQEQQLFRRPAPRTATACLPWIRLSLYSRSVSNLTWTTVPWRFLNYDPACVTEDVDFSWSEQSVGLSHNIWQIASRKEGFYLYDCEIRVEQPGTTATDDGWVGLRMTDGTNELDHLFASSDWFTQTTFPSGEGGEIEAHGVVRISGVIYIASTNRIWKPQYFHNVGGSRAMEGSYFTLTRLQETAAADWTTLTTT
jgi:hypothetical protein